MTSRASAREAIRDAASRDTLVGPTRVHQRCIPFGLGTQGFLDGAIDVFTATLREITGQDPEGSACIRAHVLFAEQGLSHKFLGWNCPETDFTGNQSRTYERPTSEPICCWLVLGDLGSNCYFVFVRVLTGQLHGMQRIRRRALVKDSYSRMLDAAPMAMGLVLSLIHGHGAVTRRSNAFRWLFFRGNVSSIMIGMDSAIVDSSSFGSVAAHDVRIIRTVSIRSGLNWNQTLIEHHIFEVTRTIYHLAIHGYPTLLSGARATRVLGKTSLTEPRFGANCSGGIIHSQYRLNNHKLFHRSIRLAFEFRTQYIGLDKLVSCSAVRLGTRLHAWICRSHSVVSGIETSCTRR
jgi:hypothetical protein